MKRINDCQMSSTVGGDSQIKGKLWKCLLGLGLVVSGVLELAAPPVAAASVAGGIVLIDKHC